MGYVDVGTVQALRGSYNLGIFFRLGTTPALHLSFSVGGDVPIQLPNYDVSGTVYTGGGRFLDVPALEVLVNGLADKVTFGLSGIDPVALSYLLDTMPEVLGARCTVGIAPMDKRWQPTTPIIGLWTGTGDYVAEQMQPETDPTKDRTQSIMLTTSTGDTSRAMPNLLTYADATQKALHPGDNFFSRLSRYIQTFLVSWPRY